MRRSKTIETLLPILYLKGISTGDFSEALAALLGKDAAGLSASTIGRLKDGWLDEHTAWHRRNLSAKRYVYVWADGIHLQARLEDEKLCMLVLIGATPEGRKELVGFIDGARESAQDWRDLLLDLKRRGLDAPPRLRSGSGRPPVRSGRKRASSASGYLRRPQTEGPELQAQETPGGVDAIRRSPGCHSVARHYSPPDGGITQPLIREFHLWQGCPLKRLPATTKHVQRCSRCSTMDFL